MRKTVVIAGAASGIGAACTDRVSPPRAGVSSGGTGPWQLAGRGLVRVDVTDHERLGELAGSLAPVDVAVNSAGIAVRKPPTITTAEEWDSVISVNLNGAFYFAQSLFARFAKPQECSSTLRR